MNRRQSILLPVMFLACFAVRPVIAQTLDKDDLQTNRAPSIQVQSQQKISPKSLIPEETKEQPITLPVMDGPIDPKEYVVGPGDIYSVNIWISPPLNFQLPVTPEGSLIIPTVGEVQVAGLRLEAAKKRVVDEIKRKFISSNSGMTLLTPRMVLVAVKGVVWSEGTMSLQSTERVEAAVSLANRHEKPSGPYAQSSDDQARRYASNIDLIPDQDTLGSRRRIVVRHTDGTFDNVDLEKYFIRREPALNPYLRDGDVVIVPRREIDRDFVGVYGGVNRQGAFEYVGGDSVLEMVKIARGLTPMADSSMVEIVRSDDSGRIAQTIRVDLSAIAAGRAEDVPLRRSDRIFVREKSSLQRDDKVYVEGEVVYPGFYPIARDSTTLSQVIAEAGGLTAEASTESSRLYRRSVSEKDLYTERLSIGTGYAGQEDTAYFRAENEVRLSREQVNADFRAVLLSHDKAKDIVLRNGDRIVIGSKKRSVYVFGQVVNPGHVSFVSGEPYSYYTEKAGGLTGNAVRSDIRVLKANTKQWLSPGETTVEDGDYIWVPSEPYRPFSYYLQTYSQIFSIVGTVATLAILAAQLKK